MPPQISQNLAPALQNLGSYIARLEGRIVKLERGARASQIGNTSIDSGQLTVNDDDGNQVLAIGLQPDGTYAVAATGSTVPDPPSTPALTPGILELLAAWDGEMDDGSTPLSDFAAVQVHCSQVAGFTPSGATLQGSLTGPGTFRIGGLSATVTYWVTLVAVNAAGNQSSPSAYASAQPLTAASAIQAGSLTAQQLGIPGGVLNPNPWFAGGYGGDWAATNGTFDVVPASAAPAGIAYGNIGQCVNNGTAAGWMGENGGNFTVVPGAPYLVTAWVNSTSGAVSLGIAWTETGTYQAATTAPVTVTPGVWTQAQAVITAPASGVNGGYPVVGTQTADGSTIYAVAILVLPSIPGTVIQAGTITADQIAAATITGAEIAAEVSLSAPVINGGIITGASIIADGTGSEYLGYSGTPAAGNLVLAIAPTAGSDGLTNSWSQGISVFDSADNFISLIPGSTNYIKMWSGATHTMQPPYIYGSLENAGLTTEFQFLAMVSGQQVGSTGNAAVQLFSDSNDGSTETANGSLVITGTSIASWNATGFTINQPLIVNDNIKLGSGNNINFLNTAGTDVLGISGNDISVFKPIYLNALSGGPSAPANTSVLYQDDNNVPRALSVIDSNAMAIGHTIGWYGGTQIIPSSGQTTINSISIGLGATSGIYHISGHVLFTGAAASNTASFAWVTSVGVHAKGWYQFTGSGGPKNMDSSPPAQVPFMVSPTLTTSEQVWIFDAWFPYATNGGLIELVCEGSGTGFNINSAFLRVELA